MADQYRHGRLGIHLRHGLYSLAACASHSSLVRHRDHDGAIFGFSVDMQKSGPWPTTPGTGAVSG
jgi:hypothetical protein